MFGRVVVVGATMGFAAVAVVASCSGDRPSPPPSSPEAATYDGSARWEPGAPVPPWSPPPPPDAAAPIVTCSADSGPEACALPPRCADPSYLAAYTSDGCDSGFCSYKVELVYCYTCSSGHDGGDHCLQGIPK